MTGPEASPQTTIHIPRNRVPTEAVLYGEQDVYHWSDTERDEFILAVIREAFSYHYSNCSIYRRYCDASGVTPPSIVSNEQIATIPLITSSVFKSLDVRSVPVEQIAKVCCSSGTRGRVSRVPRDTTSLEYFVGSIRVSAEQILDLHADAEVFNLGPDADEAGDIWFPYVMSLLGLLRPATNYVGDSIFYPVWLVEDLQRLSATTQPLLVGPPALFLHLLDFLHAEALTLTLGRAEGFVITAGGWKGFGKEVDREEFVQRCVRLLGLRSGEYVRDAYNMVELNTVLFECDAGVKHIPPWLYVEALDPRTLRPRASNEIGLLAFYDPLPTSYPGFVLSDDFGSVSSAACTCGRNGPTMQFSRRVALVEARGCALAMDRQTRVSSSVQVSRSPRYGAMP